MPRLHLCSLWLIARNTVNPQLLSYFQFIRFPFDLYLSTFLKNSMFFRELFMKIFSSAPQFMVRLFHCHQQYLGVFFYDLCEIERVVIISVVLIVRESRKASF